MSTLAVFIVLGGGAYAATRLPAHSVGKQQLRSAAVTRSKLAPRSVNKHKLAPRSVNKHKLAPRSVNEHKLSRAVRNQLNRVGPAGPAGPAGAAGAPGPAGPAGPGAARISFAADASDAPESATVLDTPGLTIEGTCSLNDGLDVSLPLTITAAEVSQAQEMISIDDSTDPGTTLTSNLGFELPAGPFETDGPSAPDGESVRIIATLIVTAPSRTFTLNAVLLVDAAAQRCSMSGTAVTAT